MSKYPKVAIVYLSYHCELYWERAYGAIKKLNYPMSELAVVVVDNPHPNYGGSAEFVSATIDHAGGAPRVVILPQEKNLGFSGGNNIGIRWAIKQGFEYIFLHNQDGFLAPDAIARAVDSMRRSEDIGAVQSLVLCHPDTELINTSGNCWHFLGFGYCGNFRRPLRSVNLTSGEIGYASGAALMLRADLARAHGDLDEDFFAYHEDLEYCARLRSHGFSVMLASDSVFFHDYEFSRHREKFFLMERNRLALLIMYYGFFTWLLIAPAFVAMEIGIIAYAIVSGWGWQKMRAYWAVAMTDRAKIWRKRGRINRARSVSDLELLRVCVGTVEFAEIGGAVLLAVNKFFDWYWRKIKNWL